MTIPENIRDVSQKLISALPAYGLIILFVVFSTDVLEYYLGVQRIKGLIEIVNACTAAKNK